MTSETILKMIENVDPDDTDTLDKIDEMVLAYRFDMSVAELRHQLSVSTSNLTYETFMRGLQVSEVVKNQTQYTRSRDALKSIRPEGWGFKVDASAPLCGIDCTGYETPDEKSSFIVEAMDLPTEELAELHAIIKAIEWERQQ